MGFSESRVPDAAVLIARNLATSQCVTFLPPQAVVRDLRDVVYWPDGLSRSPYSLLLARCADGHWRGQAGRPNLTTHDQFPSAWIDIDLSSLGRATPLTPFIAPRSQRWAVFLWSPNDRSIHLCRFDANAAPPAIQKDQALGVTGRSSTPSKRRRRANRASCSPRPLPSPGRSIRKAM